MLLALNAWHFTNHHGVKLAGVKVPPGPRAMIVAGAWLLTLRAAQRRLLISVDSDRYFALPMLKRIRGLRVPRALVDVHADNMPGRLNAKDSAVQIALNHERRIRLTLGT